jgi:hypothetical protein
MSSYSSFILNEWQWNNYFERKPITLRDQDGVHEGLSGFEAKCAFCHLEFKMGDKIRMHSYPYWFMHFDCWKKRTVEMARINRENIEKRKKQRQEQREKLRAENKDPAGSFRLSTHFLRIFLHTHGYLMKCPKCKILFHPGSLVTSEIGTNGKKIIIHYQCRELKLPHAVWQNSESKVKELT